MRANPKIRLAIPYLFFLAVLAAVLVRLVWVQIINHDFYARIAREQQYEHQTIPAARGCLYDRDMNVLAMSQSLYGVYCIPRLVSDPGATSRMLAPIIKKPQADITASCRSRAKSEWLARDVDRAVAVKVMQLNLPGLFVQPCDRRIYPERNLACHVLGYVGRRDGAKAGVERTCDVYLNGLPGLSEGGADAAGRELPDLMRNFVAPLHGFNCVLSLDKWCQFVAERELEATCTAYDAPSGAVVIMKPDTGEILAMASYPAYDPNEYGDYPPESWRNNAITSAIEPGSCVKPIVMAGALEDGDVSERDVFDCSRPISFGRYQVRDVKPVKGVLHPSEIIKRSSNVGIVQIGQRLGGRRYYEYLKLFGFGEPTGIELPGENAGIVREREFRRPMGAAFACFGQGLSATPLQITVAGCVIANGGLLVKPALLTDIRDADGRVIKPFSPEVKRRVISEKTAAEVLRMMELAVSEGGAEMGRVPGYRIAGKTGTSEVAADGGYASGSYNASFLGIAPADNPKVVIFVTIHKPKGEFFGGRVAAPAFARIAAAVLPSLQVPPAGAGRLVLPGLPATRRTEIALGDVYAPEAFKELSARGMRFRLDGVGDRVLWSSADGDAAVPRGSTVTVKLGGGSGRMPNVVGLSLRAALRRIGPLSTCVKVHGSGGWVDAQWPPAGKAPGKVTDITLGNAPPRRRAPTPGLATSDIAG